jgi:anti-sigma factor (TIGR02949 family)
MSFSDRKNVLCEWALERLEAHIDGELPPEEGSKLEAHLETCGSCTREMEHARRVRETLRAFPQKRCPDTVLETVMAQVDRETSRSGLFPSGRLSVFLQQALRPTAAAATLVLIIAMTVFIGQRQQHTGFDRAFVDDSLEFDPRAVALAEAEVKWTLAYISNIGRRAGLAIRDDAIYPGVVEPVKNAVETAFDKKISGQSRQNTPTTGGP